jgi:transcriptional regulator with XRE-family HTH domain
MEKNKVENVIKKIISVRLKKGFSFENMADELSITPAAYRKIETGETKLTVERLFKIAEIFETSVAELLELDKEVFQQTNSEGAVGYQQKSANFYQENKEIYEKLLQSKDEQIVLLKQMLEIKVV